MVLWYLKYIYIYITYDINTIMIPTRCVDFSLLWPCAKGGKEKRKKKLPGLKKDNRWHCGTFVSAINSPPSRCFTTEPQTPSASSWWFIRSSVHPFIRSSVHLVRLWAGGPTWWGSSSSSSLSQQGRISYHGRTRSILLCIFLVFFFFSPSKPNKSDVESVK